MQNVHCVFVVASRGRKRKKEVEAKISLHIGTKIIFSYLINKKLNYKSVFRKSWGK